MIYSRANLMVASVASKDRYDRGLNGVRFEPDGATVAGNGKMLMAVGPADEKKVRWPDTAGEQMEPGRDGLVLPVDLVERVLKNMVKDKRYTLQHVAMSRVPDPARVGFTSLDAKGDTVTSAALPKSDSFPDWRGVVRELRGEGDGLRVCLNRKDLIDLLKALESACPDKGDVSPVFLEFVEEGRGVIARCVNSETGQHAVGALNSYKLKEGQWLERDGWEKTLFAIVRKKKRVPPRKRRRRMHEGGK